MITQKEYLNDLLINAERTLEDFGKKYSSFDEKQLNLKPDVKKWSIGEVLEHIILINSLYYDKLDKILSLPKDPKLNSRPFKNSFTGRMMLKVMKPGTMKVKTFNIFKPSISSVNPDVYSRFSEQHKKLISIIQNSGEINLSKNKISSPASPLIRMNYGDALAILVFHTQKHFEQIERALAHAD